MFEETLTTAPSRHMLIGVRSLIAWVWARTLEYLDPLGHSITVRLPSCVPEVSNDKWQQIYKNADEAQPYQIFSDALQLASIYYAHNICQIWCSWEAKSTMITELYTAVNL